MGKISLALEFVATSEHPHLTAELRRLLADTVIMYFKCHVCHWNVEGSDFGPLHTLFGDMAAEIYGAIDPLAEHLRKLGVYTPTSLTSLLRDGAHTVVDGSLEQNGLPAPMLLDVERANEALIAQIGVVRRYAEKADVTYLANYLDERLDAHAKHGWFLRSTRTKID